MKRPKGFVTRQAKRLSDGEINRRRFVMSALSAGVTMPTALSLASKAEARVPKRGGHLRMALTDSAPITSLAPTQATGTFARALAFAYGNALTEITPEGQVVGDLAERLVPSPDHRRWIVHLRDGVTFQDDTDITAEDVARSLDKAHASGLLPEITDLTLLATNDLAITLREAVEDLPRRLADPRLVILSAQSTMDRPIGTGPYRIDAFTSGTKVELSRRPHDWKPERGHFDRVTLHAIPDALTRQTALMTGEIDFADGIDPRGVALLQRGPTLDVTESPAARHLSLSFSKDDGSVQNRDLQNAILRTIPGDLLVERVLLGHGAPGDAARRFDPQAAADLYRRSGHAGPIGYTVSDDPIATDAVQFISDRAHRAGFELVRSPASGAALRFEMKSGAPETDAEGHILLWANYLTAHLKTLAHPADTAANLVGDPAHLLQHGWFA